jgi:hypothetical protein
MFYFWFWRVFTNGLGMFLVLAAQPCAWFCPEGKAGEVSARPFAMSARPSKADPCVLVLKLISDSWVIHESIRLVLLQLLASHCCAQFLWQTSMLECREWGSPETLELAYWEATDDQKDSARDSSTCILRSNRWPAGQCRVLLHSGTHVCWKVQLILRCHKD